MDSTLRRKDLWIVGSVCLLSSSVFWRLFRSVAAWGGPKQEPALENAQAEENVWSNRALDERIIVKGGRTSALTEKTDQNDQFSSEKEKITKLNKKNSEKTSALEVQRSCVICHVERQDKIEFVQRNSTELRENAGAKDAPCIESLEKQESNNLRDKQDTEDNNGGENGISSKDDSRGVEAENRASAAASGAVLDKHSTESQHTEDMNGDPSHERCISNIKTTSTPGILGNSASGSTFQNAEQTESTGSNDIPAPAAPFDHRMVMAKHASVDNLYTVSKSEILGGGRFGQVHKCEEKATGLKLAAKIIKTRGAKDKEDVKNEISVMNQLDHVNLIQLYDAFESKHDIILVMEYVEGGELFDRIIDENCNLTELDTILFMKQICEGIRYMHQMYILHLDLKPENILCVNRDAKQIKIIDFGLARRYKPREKLKVNFGTPEFLAPEVVNYDFVSFSTDMWSVGVITYMLLSGLSPFLGDNDAETLTNILACRWDLEDEEFQDISEEAKEFISKLLIKEKSWRISASEALKHPWLSDHKLHSRLSAQKNCNSGVLNLTTK